MNKNNIHILFLLVLLALVFNSCSLFKKNKVNDPRKQKTENTNLLLEAKKEESLGNFAKAKEIYALCIKKDAKNATALYGLAGVLMEEKNYNDAAVLAKTAVELDPENKWFKLRLAKIYVEIRQFDKAAKIYEELVSQQREHIDYYYEWAAIYIYSSQYLKAIDVYDLLEEQIGINEEISIQKHKIYLHVQDYENAIKEIKALTEAFPSETKYWGILADLYSNLGKDMLAIEAYNKILEIDPNDPKIHLSLASYYRAIGDEEKYIEEMKIAFANKKTEIDSKIKVLMGYYSANEFLVKEEVEKEANELLEILISTHPEEAKAHSMYADFMFQKKDFSTAKKHLAKVLAIDSSKYLVWEEYLLCYVYLEEYDSLEFEITRALEIFPEQAKIYIISATALIQQKEYEKAVERLNIGKYFIGNNKSLKTDFFSLLGNAYHHLEKYDLSDEYYEKALAADSKNLHILNQYSYYLALRSDKLERAEELIKIALGFEPRNPSFLDTYGWVLYKQQQYEEAEIVLSKAVELLTEENAEVYEHYGDILFKTNQKEKALEYWKKAVENSKKDSSLLERKIKDEKLYE